MSSPIRPEGSKRAEAASAAAAPETTRAEARAAEAAQEALPAAGSKRRPPETLAREPKGARKEPLHLIKAHGRDARGRLLSDCFNEVLGFLPKTSITAVACTEKSTLQGVREGALEAKKIVHLRALRHLEKIVRSYAVEGLEDLAAKEAFLYTLSNEIVEWRESRRESFPKDTSAVFDTCQTLVTKAFFLPTDLLRAIVDAPIVDSHIKNGLATITRIIKLRKVHDDLLTDAENEVLQKDYSNHLSRILRDVIHRTENGHLGYAILQNFPTNGKLSWPMRAQQLIAQCCELTKDIDPALELYEAEPQAETKHYMLYELLCVARDEKATELGYIISRKMLRESIDLLSEDDEAVIDDVIDQLVKVGEIEKAQELVAYGLNAEGDESWEYVDCNFIASLAKYDQKDRAVELIATPLFEHIQIYEIINGLIHGNKFDEARIMLNRPELELSDLSKRDLLLLMFRRMLRNNKYISAGLLIDFYPDLFNERPLHTICYFDDNDDPEEMRFEIFEEVAAIERLAPYCASDKDKALFYIRILEETHSAEVTLHICDFFSRYEEPLDDGSLGILYTKMAKRLNKDTLVPFIDSQLRRAPEEKISLIRSHSLKGLLQRDDLDMRVAYDLAKDLPKKEIEQNLFSSRKNRTIRNQLVALLATNGVVDIRGLPIEKRKIFATELFIENPSADLYVMLPELRENTELAVETARSIYGVSPHSQKRNHLAATLFTTKYISRNHEVQDALYASILKDAIGRKGINIYALIAAIPEGKRKETLLATIDCVY